MKKILSIFVIFLLCACQSTAGSQKKSKRSYTNIDKNKRLKSRTKTTKNSDADDFSGEELAKNKVTNDENLTSATDEDGKYQGIYKVGNPYEIQGVAYFPENFEEYEETGMASWYGPDFHGKKTANGEVYNSATMTAAHPTLPMPSMVKVTNMRNNKSVIVRVNDRGPFSKSRVIDVSEKAAEALGFKGQGTTIVRIQLLRNDTDELLEKLNIKN